MKLDRAGDLGALMLRIGVGVIFIHAGWGKVMGIEGTQTFFGNIGIPAPVIMAWFVALAELIGGALILAGARIRYPALLMAVIMVVAILTTKLDQEAVFRAARLDLMLLLASLSLFFTGAGRFSVDGVLNQKDAA